MLLSSKLLADWQSMPETRKHRILKRAWRAVGASKVAVRSSSGTEDGESRSFAGVFESVLDVDRKNLAAAIEHVLHSFESERANSYASDTGQANILVQQMVQAEYAGVLFTRDPAAASVFLVEMVEGTGDGLVSGTRTPTAYRVGRLTGTLLGPDSHQPPFDLRPLLDIGLKSESMFRRAQDIEWAYANGRIYILQSRDIVVAQSPSDDDLIHAEWVRVAQLLEGRPPGEVALVQNEVTELLPKSTPLSLSLMQSIWSSGGSLDLASSRLGLSYAVEEDSPPYLVSVFGHTYIDKQEQTHRVLRLSRLTSRRLCRSADAIECGLRQEFLDGFLADMRIAEAIDFDRLSSADLLAEMERRRSHFIERTHVEIDVVNILAQLYFDEARKGISKHDLDATSLLAPTRLNEVQSLLKAANELPEKSRINALRRGLGHRAVFDYELQQPRFEETDAELQWLPERIGNKQTSSHAQAAPSHVPAPLAAHIDRARRFQVLKEDAKHHAMRELAVLRRILLAIGRRYGLGELVFYLTFTELAELESGAREWLRDLAQMRLRQFDCFRRVPAPAFELTPAAVEAASRGASDSVQQPGQISGTRVSGSKAVLGRARVMSAEDAESGKPIEGFRPGDIIVSRMISPAWLLHFKDAGGLVCEIGGWLSHTAVMAREYQLMMVTGVKGIEQIDNESEIEISQDGVIVVQNRREMAAAE
jgi:phosphohistidine swiveling domain-containing protein